MNCPHCGITLHLSDLYCVCGMDAPCIDHRRFRNDLENTIVLLMRRFSDYNAEPLPYFSEAIQNLQLAQKIMERRATGLNDLGTKKKKETEGCE